MAFDFKNIPPVVSPKLTLKLEIELSDSRLTSQEASERIQFLLNGSQSKAFSEFLIFLLRETRSSMWDLKSLEIE